MRMLPRGIAENAGDVERDAGGRRRSRAEEFRTSATGGAWRRSLVMTAQLQTSTATSRARSPPTRRPRRTSAALGAHRDEAFMAMRLADLRLRLGDLDGARRRRSPGSASSTTPAGSARSSPTPCRRHDGRPRGRHDDGRRGARHELAPRGERAGSSAVAHGLALRSALVVALLDVELGDLDDRPSRPRASGYAAPCDQGHAHPRRGWASPPPGWRMAHDRCEDAAELPRAPPRAVRGTEDPTDPTIAGCRRPLPGAARATSRSPRAYERGSVADQAGRERRGSTPRHWR